MENEDEKITRIKKLQKNIEKIESQTSQIPMIKDKVDRVHKCLYEDEGQGPITDRVSVLESQLKWIWSGIAFIGAGVVGFIGKMIAKIVK